MTIIRSGRIFSLALAACLFLVSGEIPAAMAESGAKGPLDGKVFVVERGERGDKADGKDVYLFRDGKFLSTSFEKWHRFGVSAYTSTVQGDAITFAADTKSKTDGTIHWEGTVRGDRIDVRYTWTGKPKKWYRPNPKPAEYWARSFVAGAEQKTGAPGGRTEASNLLDGKTYFVRTGEQGKEADHDDYLVFWDGIFVSSGCVEIDFRKSAYSETREKDGIRFRAETVSPTHGTMIWDGIVRGDVVDATARWIHKRWYWTIDRVYWYRGRLYE